MKTRVIGIGMLLAGMLGAALAQQSAPPATSTSTSTLKVGDMAPDFTLLDQNRNKVTLSAFRGKQNVVLAFYVLAFTGG